MSTEIELRRARVVEKVEAFDQRAVAASTLVGNTSMAAQVRMAQALSDLLEAVKDPEVMAPLMALQGTSLGFIADRQYRADELAMPIVEARLRGFNLTGGEFAVIKGKFYAAKAGLRRKLTDGTTFPTLTDFRDQYGTPDFTPDGKSAKIEVSATWRYGKKSDEFKTTLLIRVNDGMGPDAVIGKAERKLCKRVHDIISGINTPDVDDEFVASTNPGAPGFPSTSTIVGSDGKVQRVVNVETVPEPPPQAPAAGPSATPPSVPPDAAAAQPTPPPTPAPAPAGPQTPLEHVEGWMQETGVPWDWIQQKIADIDAVPNIKDRNPEDLEESELRKVFANRTAILRTWKAKNARSGS